MFGSWHPGVCLFLFGDGSVRPVRISVDPAILTMLGDRRDGQNITDY